MKPKILCKLSPMLENIYTQYRHVPSPTPVCIDASLSRHLPRTCLRPPQSSTLAAVQ